MITHLRNEPSDLVSHAIISNLDKTQLTSQQLQDLTEIAAMASPDLASVINHLVK
jgi:alkylhydroperoxidase family enzyme